MTVRSKTIRGAAVFLALALSGVAPGQEAVPETAQPDAAPPAAANIDALIRDLDAEEFQTREKATNALVALGEAARPKLEALAEDPPSAEVKVRLKTIFRAMQLADIRRNAVHLDKLFELVRRANDDDFDQQALDEALRRLRDVLSDATGKKDLQLPVEWKDLNRAAPDTFVRNSLVIARRGRISSLDGSIVLADVAIDISSARNSIIIARAAVNVSSPRNCIVIAGYDVDVSSGRDSVLLSGHNVDGSILHDCIVGAGEPVRTSIAEKTILVNSQPARRNSRQPPILVETEGLVLRDEEPGNPLADKIDVTFAAGDVVLFRRKSGGGELVARVDKPIEHPDGGLIEELAGWKACYVSRSRRAIFTDGQRFVALPVVAP